MKLKFAATGLFAALALAGCQRTSSDYGSSSLPPLQAQPVSPVQSNQLPPPGATGTAPIGASQFPAAPTANQQTAAMTPNPAAGANGQDFTKEQMVGNWKVSNGASNCDMFLTLTNLGSGSRGGTRGCAGPLTAMGSWEVANKQVMLKDRDGNILGTLTKSADNRFTGQTSNGQPLSLSR